MLAPHDPPPLEDPAAAVRAALRAPIEAPPLADLAEPGQRAVIVTSDLTRPVPNRLLLEALLEMLHASGVAADDVLDVGDTVARLTSAIGASEGRPATVGALPYGQQAVPAVREGVPA